MKLIRRGQPRRVPTRPAPPGRTQPITRIRSGLPGEHPAGDRLPFTQTPVTALTPPPRPRAIPAPPPMPPGWVPPALTATLASPSSAPPLRPTPPPARPRAAWTPPQPPSPPRITQPAVLAYPGGRVPPELTLPCGGTCHRVHTRGASSSFPVLYAEAERAGWRQDLYGVWACPACQAKPGWRPGRTPVPRREHTLILATTNAAAPRWRWRKALRTARIHLDARALKALR